MSREVKYLFGNAGVVGIYEILRPFRAHEDLPLLKEYDALTGDYKYTTYTVIVPDFLTDEEYPKFYHQYNRTKLYGFEDNMGRDVFFATINLKPHVLFISYRLLKTKTFKSSFRKIMKDRLDNWINECKENDNLYPSPFSETQLWKITLPIDLDIIEEKKNVKITRHEYVTDQEK